jgi:methionyl-tRNA formyltransferase
MKKSNYKTKTIFFGSSKFVLPIIKILQQNLDLTAVYTTEQRPSDPVPAFCHSLNIPYISISKFTPDIYENIKNKNTQFSILASFGIILPPQILNLFPKGILNIHPSLLPKYRGPTPVQSAILNGDITTGVTIIKLDEQMDHGPILSQQEEPIHPTDTTDTLQQRLFIKGAKILIQTLPEYLSGEIKLKDQTENNATYTKNILSRKDGFFDIDNPPSKEQLNLRIRAYYPWPGTWTHLNLEKTQKIIKFLPENKLQVEGHKPISVKDFLNGYPALKEKLKKII